MGIEPTTSTKPKRIGVQDFKKSHPPFKLC